MTCADQIREHQARCQPHLLRLRLLARGEARTTAPRQIAAEVREATNAVLAEAEAAIRTALAAAERMRGGSAALAADRAAAGRPSQFPGRGL